jgi:hypothetical protein
MSTCAPSESVTTGESLPLDLQADDTLNEVFMSVDLTNRGTVGCCYFVARDEKLFFMEDIQCGDVDVIDALRMYIDPTVILVSTKIDDAVIERFDPEGRSGSSVSGDNDQFRLPFLLEVRPPSEYSYDVARSKLVNLHLGEEYGTRLRFNIPGELGANEHDEGNIAGKQGQLLRLAGWVDVDSQATVSPLSQACARPTNVCLGWLCWCTHLISTAEACGCIPTWRRSCAPDVSRVDLGDVQSSRHNVRQRGHPSFAANSGRRIPSAFSQSRSE